MATKNDTRTTVVMQATTFEEALQDVGIHRTWEVIDWLGDPAIQIEASIAQFAQLMVVLAGSVGANDALLLATFARLDVYLVPSARPVNGQPRYWYFPGLELF